MHLHFYLAIPRQVHDWHRINVLLSTKSFHHSSIYEREIQCDTVKRLQSNISVELQKTIRTITTTNVIKVSNNCHEAPGENFSKGVCMTIIQYETIRKTATDV